jgi:hypothetical protein
MAGNIEIEINEDFDLSYMQEEMLDKTGELIKDISYGEFFSIHRSVIKPKRPETF